MSKLRTDDINLHRDGREFITGLRAEALEDDDHLGAEEIAAYVAGKMDEGARVCAESHVECCALCRREAHELRHWVRRINLTPVSGEAERADESRK